jgi:hypothetical protein
MKRAIAVAALLLAFLVASVPARADFGFERFDSSLSTKNGSPATQAGSHPFALRTFIALNSRTDPNFGRVPDGEFKDVLLDEIAGLVANPAAMPRCSDVDFLTLRETGNLCSPSTMIGRTYTWYSETFPSASEPSFPSDPEPIGESLYNLVPPPGAVAEFGFHVVQLPVTIEVRLDDTPPYAGRVLVVNIPQPIPVNGSEVVLWGNPSDPSHDAARGGPSGGSREPFLTLPRACQGPLPTTYATDSWQNPGAYLPGGEPDLSDPAWVGASVLSHDDATPPNPLGMSGCAKLGFSPTIAAQPTTKAAKSPTGLDFSLDVHDEGLTSPTGLANSDIKKTVVTLPEGFTVNPSIAEGLEVCTPAQLDRETAFSEAGSGCPNASKIGSVEVETPLLDENVNGALYQAAPYDNPFKSLVALYVVIKNPTLGIKVVQPLNVIPDPVTGRLTTVAEDMPQLPFSHFRLHFREGARSPLASPPKCGTYDAEATLYPWAGGAPVTTTSAFQIITGPSAGPCPSGGLPPFKPGLIAGSINNAAGRFSPFNIRLSRTDSEQEITHFSIKLPPGITAKLAGVPYCSNAQIAAATARTGPHGGQEELNSPSCPAASEIGRTLVGSGVGSALAYAPGKIYLAGPYHGSNLSIVAITAGVVGPFDIGTVVVREALKIDPETAEAFIDATGSDPIPHIIKGIPVHLRDIRVYTDRPNFVLNPTDCTRTSTASTVLGSGLDFGSEADDRPVTVSTPYQAADCAALPFKPKLGLKLIGGTKRGAHPAFKATLKMNGIGEAGIARAEVTLPKSEFIENAHFNTICTRVQFKAGAGNGANCPAGSIYGKARAVTPILGEPLTGPVFLRSSEHQLPDLVVALHNSQVDFDLVGHVDSVKGRLRNTFEAAPDAPVSSFVLEMKGGKKGLFVNSTNLCKGAHRAEANFDGQNGKSYDTKPELKVKCKGKARKGKGEAAKNKRRAN